MKKSQKSKRSPKPRKSSKPRRSVKPKRLVKPKRSLKARKSSKPKKPLKPRRSVKPKITPKSPRSTDKTIYLSKSPKSDKKYMMTIGNKTTHFGAKGMSDYTIHKDPERKKRYLARHTSRENHGKSGIGTAGWASATFLWNKPTLAASIKDTMSRFGVKVVWKR